MSADKIQALHNTVVEILSEPPSPPTFFDEEPYEAAQASEKVAKASNNLRRAPEIPKDQLGQLTSRELGISTKEIHEAHSVRDAKDESQHDRHDVSPAPMSAGKRHVSFIVPVSGAGLCASADICATPRQPTRPTARR